MAGFSHGPAAPRRDESQEIITRNARYGLVLFAVYLLLYGGFVALNAFAPDVMGRTVAGVTVAVLYGFALIAAAFLLALVYGWLCRSREGREATPNEFDAEGRP